MKKVIVDDDILVSSALKTILEAGGEVEVTGTEKEQRGGNEQRPDIHHAKPVGDPHQQASQHSTINNPIKVINNPRLP